MTQTIFNAGVSTIERQELTTPFVLSAMFFMESTTAPRPSNSSPAFCAAPCPERPSVDQVGRAKEGRAAPWRRRGILRLGRQPALPVLGDREREDEDEDEERRTVDGAACTSSR